ncbi:MAG: undecaprenyldiphospho-muramoylpentapeptide beta-N-acetylglucosaminyltransferase [Actinobacteria bacterium]|nr:MAG: undecaprenyldiphospho-muramoylpentapeptide beta-N-acetylglucosaminyltransferase [Actinomycetota bacterium]
MKVAICAGGTAGHIYPGISLADELSLEAPVAEVVFLGTNRGLEKELVTKAGYNFRAIEAYGFKRSISLQNIKASLSLIQGFFSSWHFFKSFKPNVVVGMGGYVSFSPLAAAILLRIPTVIHEQNSIPGLANKVLSHFVTLVAASFPNEEKTFPRAKRVIFTGNPIRRNMIGLMRQKGIQTLSLDPDRKTLLVFGGSIGAKRINESMIEAYDKFRDSKDLQIIHVTGKEHFDEVTKRITKKITVNDKLRFQAHPYLDNLNEAYAAADLVVARAGATTIAELTAVGLPSILVPYPYATGNHQQKNAQTLVDHGAARMVLDDDFNGEVLFQMVNSLAFNSTELIKMKEYLQKLGKPFAANDLAKLVIEQADKIKILAR